MVAKLPESFLQASATVSEKRQKIEAQRKTVASGSKVEARINMSAEVAGAGLCPECQQPMKTGMANGLPVLYCQEHRIALPTPDSDQGSE